MLASKRAFVLGGLMIAASLSSIALVPKLLVTDAPLVRLEDQVPMTFADWRTSDSGQRAIVSPEVKKQLEELYSDTLTRTYVNSTGERVMLSLAYGTNQGKALQVHKPEVCYAGQGFLVGKETKVAMSYARHSLPVMQLVATQGQRVEPITYWIRSGDTIVRGWYEQFTTRVSASLLGVVNDGILVRVSSISNDPQTAYAVQQRFINDMLNAIKPEFKPMFIGKTTQ